MVDNKEPEHRSLERALCWIFSPSLYRLSFPLFLSLRFLFSGLLFRSFSLLIYPRDSPADQPLSIGSALVFLFSCFLLGGFLLGAFCWAGCAAALFLGRRRGSDVALPGVGSISAGRTCLLDHLAVAVDSDLIPRHVNGQQILIRHEAPWKAAWKAPGASGLCSLLAHL